MPRKLRLEYPGALYHVMNRGDRRQLIFQDDTDRRTFLELLGQCCLKTGWQVHPLVLMPNHIHFVVETPQANLVAAMKWFLGVYTSRFHRRRGCGWTSCWGSIGFPGIVRLDSGCWKGNWGGRGGLRIPRLTGRCDAAGLSGTNRGGINCWRPCPGGPARNITARNCGNQRKRRRSGSSRARCAGSSARKWT